MTRQETTVEVGVCRPAAGGRDVAGQAALRRPTVRRDGGAIVIDIPMIFRRRSGRKEIVLPEGATTAAPTRCETSVMVRPLFRSATARRRRCSNVFAEP